MLLKLTRWKLEVGSGSHMCGTSIQEADSKGSHVQLAWTVWGIEASLGYIVRPYLETDD